MLMSDVRGRKRHGSDMEEEEVLVQFRLGSESWFRSRFRFRQNVNGLRQVGLDFMGPI